MWGWVKKAAKGAWNAISGAVAAVWGAALFFLHLGLSALDAFLTALGIMIPKRMRVYVKVLSNQQGPLINPRDHRHDNDWSKLLEAVHEARRIYRKEINASMIPFNDDETISIIRSPAPEAALRPRCGSGAAADLLGEAGNYYRWHEQRNLGNVALGYGSPITVFIVEEVQGDDVGCSPGIFSNYVVVDLTAVRQKPPWTLAHEVGHACSLLHQGAGDSLMRHSPVGRKDYLKRWQKVLARASRHVTIG